MLRLAQGWSRASSSTHTPLALPTREDDRILNRHIHQSHRRRALRRIGRAVAAGHKLRAGPPQTCLFHSLGWYRSICRTLCQREGDSSGRETSIARTSLNCGSDYRGHPAGPAPNRNRNSTRQQIKHRPAAPLHSQLDAAGFIAAASRRHSARSACFQCPPPWMQRCCTITSV